MKEKRGKEDEDIFTNQKAAGRADFAEKAGGTVERTYSVISEISCFFAR